MITIIERRAMIVKQCKDVTTITKMPFYEMNIKSMNGNSIQTTFYPN